MATFYEMKENVTIYVTNHDLWRDLQFTAASSPPIIHHVPHCCIISLSSCALSNCKLVAELAIVGGEKGGFCGSGGPNNETIAYSDFGEYPPKKYWLALYFASICQNS